MPVQQADFTGPVAALAASATRHAALDNDFFRHWMAAALPYRQVEVFAREFHARTVDSTVVIALSVLQTDDPAARLERARHLYTEYGSGDPSRAHLVLLERMLTGLLARLREAAYPAAELRAGGACPQTRAFGDARHALFTDADPRVVAGALLAQDGLAHATSARLYEGLRNYKPLYGEDDFHTAAEYFYVHLGETARGDRGGAVAGAAARCRDEVDFAQVRRGFEGVLDLTAGYWGAVHRAMRSA
ncbi:iron-containing redox enzyme family protein [Actinomadura parmotrematis]|uniref:Iron-containing redox enzyme family protein n=1 Tax=Actinomadura parmotrematis TaxID=2864039 RepID=A0ABS7FSQ8_9ACTN|nr:iron-containing redox enzyme family protein [Actinomadura parmotrematis]MBW8483439.1 iron-containing redox enzyme family protein [Actinomadura parmotrematis]